MSTNQPFSDPAMLPVIETILSAVPTLVVARDSARSGDRTDAWRQVEEQITAWAPANDEPDARRDDDGYLLPSSIAISVSLEIAARLREAGTAAPVRHGQTANGGITFEWRSGDRTERLVVNDRGETELLKFENSRLVSRKSISLGSVTR